MSRIFPFSEATSIAIRSMVLLSQERRPVSISNIAKITGSSKHHVAKVLQRLVQKGLIFSKPGPYGGFSINRKIHRISLLDIYESVEGTSTLNKIRNDKRKNLTPTLLEELSSEISNHFITFLRNHSLSSLTKQKFEVVTEQV